VGTRTSFPLSLHLGLESNTDGHLHAPRAAGWMAPEVFTESGRGHGVKADGTCTPLSIAVCTAESLTSADGTCTV
jgi:hypothetical protein